MPAPMTNDELLELLRKSGVQEEKKVDAFLEKLRAGNGLPGEPSKLAGCMVRDGLLTNFQAEQLLLGKWRRFTIGKYKVLERLGSGGMATVFLCEHKLMRRRVAVKILPTAKADDPSSLERFYREARAVAALDHPNIVRAYDIDQDDNLHFLVMEYVDGASLQEIGKRVGALSVERACNYMRQAAHGLQHAHESAGLVHRDIKPGNILVDRNGVVKILDMGLARFFHDEEDVLTKKYDENVLGTADYLAPEQALDSHSVDIRADIYSLGATFYFCLTGRTPFNEGTVAQKLIWHQTRQPKPIRSIKPEVPEGVAAIVEKMMAKEAALRYQTPQEVVEALGPWTQTFIPPPPVEEMPRLCPAAMGPATSEASTSTPTPSTSSGMPSPTPRKNWQVSGAAVGRAVPSPRPAITPPPRDPRAGGPPAAHAEGGTLTKPAATPAPGKSAEPQHANGNGRATKEILAATTPAEDRAAWEQVTPAADTDNTKSRGDNAPTEPKKTPTPGLRPALMEYRARERRRFILVLIVVSVMVVAGLITALILALLGNGDNTTPNLPASASTLYVQANSKDGAYPTWTQAVRMAKPGYRIVVRDPIIEWDGGVIEPRAIPDNLTIEPDVGKIVRWRLKPGIPPRAMLRLSNLKGFTLRGFIFDGEGRVQDLIALSGTCPGLTLEGLTLKGFDRSAISITNCQGSGDHPVRIMGLQIEAQPAKPVESAFSFAISKDIPSIPLNQHIHISDIRLDQGTNFTKGLVQPSGPDVLDKLIDRKTVILP